MNRLYSARGMFGHDDVICRLSICSETNFLNLICCEMFGRTARFLFVQSRKLEAKTNDSQTSDVLNDSGVG